MNATDQEKWREAVLQQVLKALAESEELSEVLIFKGAWILNYHLQTVRHSRDIDSNLSQQFVFRHPDVAEQKAYLERWIRAAVERYFQNQPVVKFRLAGIVIDHRDHPMGWSSFSARLQISDLSKASTRGLPTLDIDIAAPEELSEFSITDGALGSRLVKVYSLERIAGEKARAYLSSLPTYCRKFKKPHAAIRVKDLYDLVRISRARPLSDDKFWMAAGQEFERACRSRFVDCLGWASFDEKLLEAEALFEVDATLPKDVAFREVKDLLPQIVAKWEGLGFIPKRHEFPVPSHQFPTN